MKMYVSIICIRGVFSVYSPDLDASFTISEEECLSRSLPIVNISKMVNERFTGIPLGKLYVINGTKKYLRDRGCGIESFIDTAAIEV